MQELCDDDLALWRELCADIRPIRKNSARDGGLMDSLKESPSPLVRSRHVAALEATPRGNLPSAEELLRPQKRNWQQKHIAEVRHDKPRDFVEMDGRLNRRFRAGKIPPDAVLDLHGQTEHEAAQSFSRFFHRAVMKQSRYLLVITGKGKGVLHRALADWLERPEMKSHLSGVSMMPPHRGGSGAFGLYLKRKKG